jgi:hypothetical protein
MDAQVMGLKLSEPCDMMTSEKKRSDMKKTLPALCVFLVFLSSGWGLWAQKTRIVDGATIITNGKNPNPQKGVPSNVRWEEDFTIGTGDNPEQSFALVSSFVVDDDGTIYALDTQDTRVKIYDRSGSFIKLFGQKGQGPGEFDTPVSLHLSPEDELVVEDAIGRRLVFFTKEGAFIRNLSMAAQLGAVNTLMDGMGGFIDREMGFEGNLMFFEMKKYDKDFKPLFSIDKIDFPLPLPGSGNKINVMDFMAIYQFDNDGNILYGRNLDYEIKILSPEGKHIRSIRKEYEPVKVTEEDITNMLKMIPNVGAGNIKDMLEFPKDFPPYQHFTVDESGRLFVKTWEKGKNENEFVFDVFDAEGRYIDRFETKLDIMLWKSEKMYAIEEDDEGYRVIKRFSVFWDK